MRRSSANLIAWAAAGCCFVATTWATLATRPMFIARATAEISKTVVSPEGLATFSQVAFGATNRMMPNETVSRLRSPGTIGRALRLLHQPDDERAVAQVSERTAVRLIAGTTLIETIVRSDSAEDARALAGALFTAHEALRRERRSALTASLVASLDAAVNELRTESEVVAKKLAGLDVYRPAGAGRYSGELDRAFVDVAAEGARLQATLQRLEAIPPNDTAALSRELDDVARTAIAGQAVADQAGFLILRASLANKLGELANVRTQFGENSPRMKSTQAELAALQESLRGYFAGQLSQLRAQLATSQKTGVALDTRTAARQERARAIQVATAAPEAEALGLRRDSIRTQLRRLELRRRELLVYDEVYEPGLTILDPPQATDAPEIAHRDARLVLAGFGSLLVGFSLSIILNPRAAAVL